MAEKKFKSTNYDICTKVDIIIPESETEYENGEYYCICGCHSKLEEIKEKNNTKKWALIASGVVVVCLIAWLGITLFSNEDKQVVDSHDQSQTEELLVIEEPEVDSNIEDSEETVLEDPVDNLKEELESQLFSIGNSKQQMKKRIAAIEPTLKEFFSSTEAPKVKVLGKQGTVVEIKDAESYLKWLAGIVTLQGLKVHDVEYDRDGKVRLLEVEEIHETN